MLLLTLRFYATGSFLNVVGDLNGVHKATASVRKVSDAIASLSGEYIRFPRTNEEIQEVMGAFYVIASFPRVIGTIDCTHVKIQSPGGDNAEAYRNRKGYFSLNVQTVCDHNLRIRNIVCRWPGSAHDSHIFNNSNLRHEFERAVFGNNLLLGDSGYKNRNFLLTPLLNPITRAENLYNEAHIRTRNCVERSYGVWKRRFPVLANGVRLQIRTIQSVVVATAVLHNIACDEGEEVPPVDADIEAAINADNIIPQEQNYYHAAYNNRTRHNLIVNYFNNLDN
ncbi:hypothetical protein MML48_1g14935 [Holotrichia oblita]|uniref:Uncharacterized protein n=1 Tax=Holotrichia oblita TaxID=644536 RepID=A0ACB9TVC4_HOLOL|nr:hypothetical protein MML48_1g14935 [Holotrichia oblita]